VVSLGPSRRLGKAALALAATLTGELVAADALL
jgi:hypothetical protein